MNNNKSNLVYIYLLNKRSRIRVLERGMRLEVFEGRVHINE